MPKKKTKPKRTNRTPSRESPCTFCRYIALVLMRSRDLNVSEKAEITRLAKALKD